MTVMSGPGKTCRWEPAELVSTLLSAGARQVVRLWISAANYLDDYNEPVILNIAGHGANGFERLVTQASQDLTPSVILNELLRKGIVEEHINGQLLLRRSAYAPGQPRLQNGWQLERALNMAPPIRRRRYNDIG
ncbi:hypothetical protein [Marinobacter sp.]|uniref:hypothetical protein n=1 Tax=Marinobacter sp. TaxID=50741 RepID=UPI0034A1B663